MASASAPGPRHSRHRRANPPSARSATSPARSASADPASAAPARGETGRPPAARLPVTELLFDRAGAASPFGDDQTFPLPVSALAYRHPGAEH